VKLLGLQLEPTNLTICVSTPVGTGLEINTRCAGCELRMSGRAIPADLLVMNFTDFDVILGMDWLTPLRAVIDCLQKQVQLTLPTGVVIKVQGTRKWVHNSTVFLLKAQLRSLSIHDDSKSLFYPAELHNIPIVSEFPTVFLNDLPGLPPLREFEFEIKLILGTEPISIPPYKMSNVELIELE